MLDSFSVKRTSKSLSDDQLTFEGSTYCTKLTSLHVEACE